MKPKNQQISTTINSIEINDSILKHRIKLAQVMFIPFLSIVGLLIYVMLRGFGNRRTQLIAPLALKMEFPLWLVLLLGLILFIIVSIVFRLFTAKDTESEGKLLFSGNQLIIDRKYYKMTFKKSKFEKFNISISRPWGLFFTKFYRIGKIRFKYMGDSFYFLFPVRDMILEEKINNINK
jgi:hypothetical protein